MRHVQRNRFGQSPLLRHAAASLVFGLYAMIIAQTSFVSSGLMFVFPLFVVFAVHAIWLAGQTQDRAALAQQSLLAAVKTVSVLLVMTFIAEISLPAPAVAADGSAVGILAVLFCLFVLFFAVAVIGGALFCVLWLACLIWRKVRKNVDNQTNDLGSILLVSGALIGMSLEGTTGGLSIGGDGEAVSTHLVAATPERVWATLETATSPDFPLPTFLRMLPKPVTVRVDEGVALGANRVVHFFGREGTGDLKLQVVERTETEVRFQVMNDSTPIAAWVALKGLSYVVLPDGSGTRLELQLHYDRSLSPAWIFGPMIKYAAYLAMDTLARDVKSRSLGLTAS